MTNNTRIVISRAVWEIGAADDISKEDADFYAQAVLNAISEAGMVIVPVEPTPDMLIAMEAALNYQGVDNVEVTDGLEAYRAAIKAGNK